MSAASPFFQFSLVALLSHWYHHWVKTAPACLKHAEKQSETRRVQSFGAKSGASVQPSSVKVDLKALILLFRTLNKSFVGLE